MRRFLIKISYTVLPLWLVLFCAGLVYKFRVEPNLSGDLGRLGKFAFGHEYKQALDSNLLKECWVDDFNGKPAKGYRVITIGDSFSQQGKAGYQNYLGYFLKCRVLNIRPGDGVSPERLALTLLRTGWLREMSPGVVVVETVERHWVENLFALDFSGYPSEAAARKLIYRKKQADIPKSADCLYETVYWMRLRLKIDDPVKKVELNRELFSHFDDELYFYYADLQRTSMRKKEKEKVYAVLDSLEQEFRQQGIQLVYTVAADKYDVYQPFVKDNTYPACNQLDSLPGARTPSYLVNTAKILRPLVRKGVKDVYIATDSHWSYIASEAVAGEIAAYLRRTGFSPCSPADESAIPPVRRHHTTLSTK